MSGLPTGQSVDGEIETCEQRPAAHAFVVRQLLDSKNAQHVAQKLVHHLMLPPAAPQGPPREVLA